MSRCKIFNFLFILLPFKYWQDFLIRHHIQECPLCQEKMVNAEEVKSLLIQEDEGKNLEGLWPALKMQLRMQEKKEKSIPQRRVRWAYFVSALFAVVAVGILLYFTFILEKGPPEESEFERFQINYIKVENRPARAFLFRPRDSKMTIVWAEKIKKKNLKENTGE